MRKLLAILVVTLGFTLSSTVVLTPTASAAVAAGCSDSTSFLGFPTWYKYLDIGPEEGDPCAVTGPKNAEGEFDWEAASGRIALAIIEILLRIATIVSLGYVVYGGFRYITSQGEPDATKSARQTIINAMIGLVIALLATGIVAFVANRLTTSSPTTNVNGPR